MSTVTRFIIECDVCGKLDAESVRFCVEDLDGNLDLCAEHREAFDDAVEPWLQVLDRLVAAERASRAAQAERRRGAQVECPQCGRKVTKGRLPRHQAAKHPEAAA